MEKGPWVRRSVGPKVRRARFAQIFFLNDPRILGPQDFEHEKKDRAERAPRTHGPADRLQARVMLGLLFNAVPRGRKEGKTCLL